MRGPAVTVILAAALVSPVQAPPALAASHTIVVARGQVVRIGDFRTSGRTGGSLAGAVRAFGSPSSLRSFDGDNGCSVRWTARRITALFAYFGVGAACVEGRVQTLTVRTRAWRTERGPHVGDRLARLPRRHPEARRHGSSWWLFTAISPYGPRPTRYPLLRARIEGGRVRSLTAVVGAAGE